MISSLATVNLIRISVVLAEDTNIFKRMSIETIGEPTDRGWLVLRIGRVSVAYWGLLGPAWAH